MIVIYCFVLEEVFQRCFCHSATNPFVFDTCDDEVKLHFSSLGQLMFPADLKDYTHYRLGPMKTWILEYRGGVCM